MKKNLLIAILMVQCLMAMNSPNKSNGYGELPFALFALLCIIWLGIRLLSLLVKSKKQKPTEEDEYDH